MLGGVVGEVIKIDRITESNARGIYARIAVCLDLTKPLESRIEIEGRLQLIEYEGLPNICFHCGRYGHPKEECLEWKEKEKKKEEMKAASAADGAEIIKDNFMEAPSKFGPWMVVPKGGLKSNYANTNYRTGQANMNGRGNNSRNHSKANRGNNGNKGGSRFDALQEIDDDN